MDNSDFRSLWLGQLASTLGTWLLVVGVPLHIYDMTGSAAATGAAFVAETLPALLFGPAAGVLVDRLDRRTVMVVADIVRALAILSMLLARDPGDLWIIYSAILVENGAAQIFRPARQALIPALVREPGDLSAANSMFGLIDGVVRLVGSVLGGALYAGFGFPALVVADSASYVLSAVSCLLIRYRAPRRRPGPATLTAGLLELGVGLRHIRGNRLLRGLVVVTACFYLVSGALTALLVPFARTQLHVNNQRYGYLLAALGVGYLFGSPLARLLIERWSTRAAVLVSVPWLAVCFGLAFGPGNYPLAITAFALAGAPAVVLLVAVQTAAQRHTPEPLLGRVTAAFLTVEMTVYVAGASVASTTAEAVGVMPVITASLILLGGLVALLPQVLPRGEAPGECRTGPDPSGSGDGRSAAPATSHPDARPTARPARLTIRPVSSVSDRADSHGLARVSGTASGGHT